MTNPIDNRIVRRAELRPELKAAARLLKATAPDSADRALAVVEFAELHDAVLALGEEMH
ncbi:hypothetical protein KQ313_07760 [Synechococcus sp. CS-1325]|uniref:hypothetical protein n=1 Tax=Synechococcus sp. CS-1325 TaxID=2847979 RepID=UPI00223B1979|nr:hypothetical protein [Synechococcus sp. CS-1325]MCT0199570.1 hypothetical protein [Synechococcus sp. CS-1325]